jgi:hypothetical protein
MLFPADPAMRATLGPLNDRFAVRAVRQMLGATLRRQHYGQPLAHPIPGWRFSPGVTPQSPLAKSAATVRTVGDMAGRAGARGALVPAQPGRQGDGKGTVKCREHNRRQTQQPGW